MAVDGKPTNKQITAKLDRLARELCHYRHNWQCARCGGKDNLHWAHIVARSGHKAIRWSPYNSVTLCKTCHSWFDRRSTSRQQYHFINSVSPGSFDWLEALDNGIPRVEKLFDLTVLDMVLLADNMKAELMVARAKAKK